MTPEQFNQNVFNILLQYSVYNEFGDTEILNRTDLTQLEKEKVKNSVNNIQKFNQHSNEKFIQFGQDDQPTT